MKFFFLLKDIKIEMIFIDNGVIEWIYSQAIFDRLRRENGTVNHPNPNPPVYNGWIERVYEGTEILDFEYDWK